MAPRIAESVKQDHREIEACYIRMVNTSDKDEQTRFKNLFTWELARNLVAEEIVVYPALEKHVQGGTTLANKNREQHQKIKEQLKTFQSLGPSDQGFIPTLDTLMQDLRQHMREEEINDLGILEEAMSSHDSQNLSKWFNRAKIFLPSRAHPSAPSKPPFETAVGLLTAPVDQVGDLFRKWPHKSQVAV
ncbi:hypothetical protein ARAM_001737 [Aspergillus rambellii]|uniref:Hemerythrin-like domain-containing protein n=1 Tax=Aspergillus rambellii TaxID=308745 RepID=A0A0F8WRE6_9EURO|nr:hypothetical protein ARAM_001737 [Aspergillus rambellii]